MLVYVINKHGKPLMPCKPRKARILLKEGRAKVVKRTPFTIQLIYGSSGYKQPVSLGVDPGYKNVGLSATTKKKVLFEAEVSLRTDMVKLLSTKREFRRARRLRNTRYRKPRFLNRKKAKGWIAPSVQNRVNTHLKVINGANNILPINKTVIEIAQFDIQKIKNPNISGVEYQQGDQLGFWNVREYVLWRDTHTCQYCKGKSKDPVLNVHHLESRKTGGDAPSNLITLCETCHKAYHLGLIEIPKKRGQSFKGAAFMGVVRKYLYRELQGLYPSVGSTYGYITKNTRINNNLDKSHCVDARCISGNPVAHPSKTLYLIKQVRKQNRQLHKTTIRKGGLRQKNKAPRYVKGFQLFDKVLYQDQECFIFGRRSSGYFDLRLLDGTKVTASANCKNLKTIEKANTLLVERRQAASSPYLKKGVSAA